MPQAPPVDEPLFFYDFEGDEGDLVTDKADRGNDADVTRPGQTTLGVPGGAPQGSSPGTAIEFDDGLLNVPGVEMAEIISGEGSYTFSAWLKPTDLGGDKFGGLTLGEGAVGLLGIGFADVVLFHDG